MRLACLLCQGTRFAARCHPGGEVLWMVQRFSGIHVAWRSTAVQGLLALQLRSSQYQHLNVAFGCYRCDQGTCTYYMNLSNLHGRWSAALLVRVRTSRASQSGCSLAGFCSVFFSSLAGSSGQMLDTRRNRHEGDGDSIEPENPLDVDDMEGHGLK